MKPLTSSFLLAVALALLLAAPAPASTIAPDRGFGGAGLATLGPGVPGYRVPNGVGVAADGSVLVAGASTIARFGPGGRLDRGYGDDGLAVLGPVAGIDAIGVGADGRAVVVSGQRQEIVVATGGGRWDPGFGFWGVASVPTLDPRLESVRVWSVAALGEGGVLAAGIRFGSPRIVVFRLDATGRLDASFGSGGVVILPLSPGADGAGAHQVAVGGDGSVLVSGYEAGSPALLRLRPDGRLDPTFGRRGRARLPARIRGIATALAPTPRGGAMIAGAGAVRGRGGLFLLRVGPAGRLDPRFGPRGGLLEVRRWARATAVLPLGPVTLLAGVGPGPAVRAFDRRGRPLASLRGTEGVPSGRVDNVAAAAWGGSALLAWSPPHASGEGEIQLWRFRVG